MPIDGERAGIEPGADDASPVPAGAGAGTTPAAPARIWIPALLFGAIAVAVAVVARGGPIAARMAPLQLVWGAGSLAWVAVCVRAFRRPGAGPSAAALVAGALVLRVLVWSGDPGLSDDIYRYVWEGGLVARGESPYACPPAAPERAAERAEWPEVYAGLNNEDVSAAYPPLAQWTHAALVTAAGGPASAGTALFAMRAFYGLCDLACLVALLALLRRRGLPAAVAVVWAWSPLVALEFAGSAHFDSLGILLLLVGLLRFESRGAGSVPYGALALAAGALVKLVPLLALPFAWRGRGRRAALVGGGLFAFAFVAAWVPFAGAGGLGTGLGEYGLRWESASLVFRGVEAPLAALFDRDGGPTDPRRLARVVVGLVWLAVAWRVWTRVPDLVRACGAVIGAFLVLSPTLHPWYLAWVLPFVAFSRSRAWMALVVVAPLAYWPLTRWYSAGEWVEPAWLWPVLAGAFFGTAAFEQLERRRSGAA